MHALPEDALDTLFRKARTSHGWRPEPVSDEQLHALYELMKWGPTSANTCPARVVFLRTPEARQRLLPALAKANVEQTMSAPVTAIVAYDLKFFENQPKLFPHNPGMRDRFASAEFFPEGHVKSNFLCNLGHADPAKIYPRGARLDFEEACQLL